MTQEEVVRHVELLKQLTGRVLQRILDSEMTACLAHEKNTSAAVQSRSMWNDKR
jgi:transposase-like protein